MQGTLGDAVQQKISSLLLLPKSGLLSLTDHLRKRKRSTGTLNRMTCKNQIAIRRDWTYLHLPWMKPSLQWSQPSQTINTSFRSSLEQTVDTLEIQVREESQNQLVILHSLIPGRCAMPINEDVLEPAKELWSSQLPSPLKGA